MARKQNQPAHASFKVRGLKVFGALLVGIALAVLITQYNAVQERTKRFAGRAKTRQRSRTAGITGRGHRTRGGVCQTR